MTFIHDVVIGSEFNHQLVNLTFELIQGSPEAPVTGENRRQLNLGAPATQGKCIIHSSGSARQGKQFSPAT